MNKPFTDSALRSHLLLTTLATSLGFVVVQLDVTIVNVALATVARELNADVSQLQWIVDAYAITFAALLLSGGGTGDRFGARRAFVAGFLIFTLGSAACGFAPSIGAIVAARIVQGVGAALVLPCSLALLSHSAGGNDALRARAIGLWTAGGGAALAAGPVIGGVLINLVGWRSIFLVNLPIGLIGIWLALRYTRETPVEVPRRGLDMPGQLLAVVGLALITGAAIEGGKRGWSDPLVIGAAALGIAAMALFVTVEARSASPLLPLHLFGERSFSSAIFAGLLVNLTLYGLIFVLSLYFQRVLGYGPLATGLAFIPMTATVTLSNVAGGWAAGRFGPRAPMGIGFALGSVGYGLLALVTGPHSHYGWFLPGMVLVPIGIGLAVPAMTEAVIASAGCTRSGVASGTLNTVRQAGGAIGVAAFGAMVGGDAIVSGVVTALIASAIILGGAAVLSALGVRTQPRKP